MYSDRIYLTPQDILEKEFKIDARGYRPQEVDKFLDMVIRDYTEYISIIKQKEKENKDLMADISKLKQEIRSLNEDIEIYKVQEANNSNKMPNNVDLLKRISQLEKAVFGNGE